MSGNLSGAVWRLTIFLVVCCFFIFALFALFAQLRFQDEDTYKARFANVSGLQSGQFVRIAGVEVGKVQKVKVQPDKTVIVEFTAASDVVLTGGSRAVIRYDDLIGGRYLAIEEGTGGLQRLNRGDELPLANTSPALDLDALIGGFRPLFRALDPDQVNALTSQLISAFQGQGDTINSFFQHAATLTSTLAERDRLIGDVIINLNTVMGALGDQNNQFASAVDSLTELMSTLSGRKEAIVNSVAHTDAAARTVSDLLVQARPPLQKVVAETDRTASLIVADHEYVDNVLNTLPEKYKILGRLGLYGDFFSFYLCDAVLKVNGKGGQPVYIKLASQITGRCAPR